MSIKLTWAIPDLCTASSRIYGSAKYANPKVVDAENAAP